MTTYPHIKLVAAGTLGTGDGNEIWSCGMKLGVINTLAPGVLVAPTQGDVDAAAAAGVTFWKALITTAAIAAAEGALFSDWVAVTSVKSSAIAADGKADPAVNTAITDIGSGNRGIGDTTPADNAMTCYEGSYTSSLVVTLRGAIYLRGSAALGRFYLPMPNLFWSSADGVATHMLDGLTDPSVADKFALAVGGGISANLLNKVVGAHTFSIANIGQSTDLAGLRWQPVNKVLVDNRPDTVRRRSNKISGEYKAVHAL